MRLDWARAAENESEVRRALSHLPPDRVPQTELLSLRAWFARRAGDAERERHALEELVECDPGALAAMESLAELLLRTGRTRKSQDNSVRGEESWSEPWTGTWSISSRPTGSIMQRNWLGRPKRSAVGSRPIAGGSSPSERPSRAASGKGGARPA